METIALETYAKVNLALDILGRREDGYHDMRMVMQTVSLGDTLTVTVAETSAGFSLTAQGIELQPDRKSLEQQAAEAFFDALGRPVPGLAVRLEKRIPAYAGLGGGSADIAAVLRALRSMYCPEMPMEELETIGAKVGSDVPFCLRGGTCLVEGRGEVLTDLPPLPKCAFVLCKPNFDLPTPALFARVDRQDLGVRPDVDGMMAALEQGDLTGVTARLGNVFEAVLEGNEAEAVGAIKHTLLRQGALGAAMSGSGPTVFGIFPNRAAARVACRALVERYPQTYLAEPLKRFRKAV